MCDYPYLSQQNISAESWKDYAPTNRRFLNGYAWFYFDVNRVNFVLRSNKNNVLEDIIFTREDCLIRDLFG